MENKNHLYLKDLKNEITAYLDLKLQITKLMAYEKIAKTTSLLVSMLFIAFISFFVFLFIFLSVGFYLAEITQSNAAGFGIIAAFYLIVLIVFLLIRKNKIENKLTDKIIKLLAEDDE